MTESLEITHLGGLGEFGKNCLVMRARGRAIVVDAGISFGDELLPGIGVDRIVPDFSVLAGEAVGGIFLTHGHEDHIGALPMLLDVVHAPVYATPFTAALADRRLVEDGLDADLRAVRFGDPVAAGGFTVTFFPVSHSVPQAAALLIEVDGRRVFHTGDFKFDADSPPGEGTDIEAIAGRARGCDLLMIDSTNADREGSCPSERLARDGLARLVGEGSDGRIVMTTFSSHVVRIGSAVEAARASGRKVALLGRSISEIAALGERHGYLALRAGAVIDRESLRDLSQRRTFVICAGSQGEPQSALTRLSLQSHPDLDFSPGDRVLFSARTIPGREAAVARVVDDFLRGGASVVRDAAHVSGHALRDDLERLVRALEPRAVMPVHGRRESLENGRGVARRAGIPADRIFVLENGDSLWLGEPVRVARGARRAGVISLDSGGTMAIGDEALRDRRQLAAGGVVVVSVDLPSRTVAAVDLRGVAAPPEAAAEAAREIEQAFSRASRGEAAEREWLLSETLVAAKRYFRRAHGVRPLIVPVASRSG